mgnify:CR=1 FL=1
MVAGGSKLTEKAIKEKRQETADLSSSSNLEEIRSDFPIFSKKMYGKQLVYLDTAASAQKPKLVIDSIKDFYEKKNTFIKAEHTVITVSYTHLTLPTNREV